MKPRTIVCFLLATLLIPFVGILVAQKTAAPLAPKKDSGNERSTSLGDCNPTIALGTGWMSNGTSVCAAANTQSNIELVSDGAGGAIICWQDGRNGGGDWNIYAQRVSAGGIAQWGTNGTPICTEPDVQQNPQITSDGAGGAIIAWEDRRSGSNVGIYAQRVSASGAMLWIANGTLICNATGSSDHPVLVSDGSGGAVIAWAYSPNGADNYIYAQRVNSTGGTVWGGNGTAIYTISEVLSINPYIVSDCAGGAIIAWVDYRDGSTFHVYAQRINAAGKIMWDPNGMPVCTASIGQGDVQLTSDGAGGAVITWDDARGTSPHDIYAQRVRSDGVIQWTANGSAVCTAIDDQAMPMIVSDGTGGAIITWMDHRSGSNYHIYAQRVNAIGSPLWAPNGTVICNAISNQYYPQLASDGAGGAIISWQDLRTDGGDIYAQRVNSAGTTMWVPNGTVICNAVNVQQNLQIVSDGTGGVIVAWEDMRNGIDDNVYVQSVVNGPPSVNAPPIINTWPAGTTTIPWVLQDDQGAGFYQVIETDANGIPHTWVSWTPWTIGVPLNVPIDRTVVGKFNYTIQYTDDENIPGTPNTVAVSVKNFAVSGPATVVVMIGAAGNVLQWTVVDEFSPTPIYAVLRDGSIIQQGTCVAGVPLTYSLEGLTPGTYNYTLVATEASGSVQSTTIVTVQKSVLALSHPPDAQITAGTTGNVLSWVAIGTSAASGATYTVYRNGTAISSGACTSGQELQCSVDGLAAGVYNFTIVVSDGYGGTAQDTTIVTVLAAPAPATPVTEILLGIFGGVACGVLAIAVVVLFRMQGHLAQIRSEMKGNSSGMPPRRGGNKAKGLPPHDDEEVQE